MKRILTFLFLFSSLFASSQTQFLGAPNTTIIVKGNMKVDSILYLPKRSKTPTDTGALRYQISDSSLYVWTGNAWRKAKNDGTVTSVGLTMPSAFAVANSPVTSAGTLAVTATGSATEYIRGDGTLGTLPTSGGGGGSGVNYYLNGSVSQGTIGGSTYYEMNKVPVVGTGTNFTASSDGLIAQFITDVNDPNRLLIPAGAWNFELYFSASSAGGTPTFYVELLKYDGTTFTSIASSSANPIPISNGTVTSLYVASLAVTETVLTTTDRLAIRVYTNVSGRTITFHTEDNNLAQVITTFAGGVVSLNGLTANDQFFATGTTGTNFNIASTSATHTFNLPTASATNRGALSSTDWSTFNNKVNISDTATMLTPYIRHAGNGLTKTGQALSVDTAAIATRSRVQKGIDSVASVRIGGTGTINRSAKFTASGAVGNGGIADSSSSVQMTILSSGFVGVNVATPLERFHVNGAGRVNNSMKIFNPAYGTDYATSLRTDASANGILQLGNNGINYILAGNSAAGGQLSFRTNVSAESIASGSEALRIFSNGRLFVGSSPADAGYQLDVAGTLRNTTGANFATSSGNVLVGTVTDGGAYKLDVQGALRNTTDAAFATTSGRVGIGTTSPLSKLHVRGNFEPGQAAIMSQTFASIAQGGTAGFGNFDSIGTRLSYWAHDSTGMVFFNAASTRPTIFYGGTSGLERMRIAPWGFLGVGITNPLGRIVASGSESGILRGLILRNSNGATNSSATIDFETSAGTHGDDGSMAGRISGIRTGAGTTGAIALSTTNGGTLSEKMRIIGDGNVGIGNISPSEKLHVTGRIRATTIDSTSSPINMLTTDVNGVIRKAAVPSGGGGSVTSITAGTGLTGGTITTSGTIAVDTASIATRARVQKGIDSVTTLANTKLSGTGISGYFPKWTGASTQDTSQLFQLGRNIGIGTASPTYRIHLPDAGNVNAQAMIAGTVLGSDGNGQTIRPSGSVAMALFGQSDIGYIYGAAVSSTGRWGVNTRSLNDATFNVDGSVKIVTIDSTSTARNMLYQDANGVIKKSAVPTGNSGVINTSIAVASANYTVTSTDHFVYLGDLSSAGRNIVLPNDAVAGRQLIFFNTSNDATFKWTFTNEDVQDITGAAVTTLTNRKTYMLVFYEGVFHIISEN